jgi:hypothetical protein
MAGICHHTQHFSVEKKSCEHFLLGLAWYCIIPISGSRVAGMNRQEPPMPGYKVCGLKDISVTEIL